MADQRERPLTSQDRAALVDRRVQQFNSDVEVFVGAVGRGIIDPEKIQQPGPGDEINLSVTRRAGIGNVTSRLHLAPGFQVRTVNVLLPNFDTIEATVYEVTRDDGTVERISSAKMRSEIGGRVSHDSDALRMARIWQGQTPTLPDPSQG